LSSTKLGPRVKAAVEVVEGDRAVEVDEAASVVAEGGRAAAVEAVEAVEEAVAGIVTVVIAAAAVTAAGSRTAQRS
jgi:hypothetical protein